MSIARPPSARPLFRLPVRLGCWLICCCLALGGTAWAAEAAAALRHVLLLHSYHPGMDWVESETAGLREALASHTEAVELHVEYIDAKRIVDPAHLANLRQLLAYKYAQVPLSAVVAADNDALDFVRTQRSNLFPGVPVVFCGINFYREGMLGSERAITGVAETFDGAATVALMLRLHPQTQQIVVISDDTTTGYAVRAELEPMLAPFRERVAFQSWHGLSLDEMRTRLAALPRDSLVLLLPYAADRAGRFIEHERMAQLVSQASPVPVYSAWDFYLGHGVIGGYLTSGKAQGAAAGALLLRVLSGADAGTLPVVRGTPARLAFDYLQLERFGQPLSLLPMGSEVLNLPWYERNKGWVWLGALLAVVFAGLTVSLEISMRRRRRADDALRRNMAVLLSRDQALGEISQGVLICDAEGRISYVNHALEKITGYLARSLVGSACAPILGVDEAAERARLREAVTPDGIVSLERLCPHADGSSFWCELSVSPVRDAAGQLTQRVYVLRDITERKRVESELRVAAIAFESQASMLVTDPNGIVLRVNQAFQRASGYAAEDIIGMPLARLRSDRHDRGFYDHLWETVTKNGAWQGVIWLRYKDGSVHAEWLSLTAVLGAGGEVAHFVCTYSDVLENESAEAEAHRLAYYDPLTRLPNRRLLHERLGLMLEHMRAGGESGALLMLDLDNFKAINDTRSHDAGDRMLIEVARRLRQAVPEPNTVARLAGDEFVVLLGGRWGGDAASAAELGEALRLAVAEPFQLNGRERLCTASIGIKLFDAREQADTVLKCAEAAMYQAKEAGRNLLRFFDPAVAAALDERNALDHDLHYALRREEFVPYFQPKLDGAGEVVGAEVLLRWRHPVRGLVPPGSFIPLAEESEQILAIGHWVLEQACRRLAAWQAGPECNRQLQLAVNVSPRQFRQDDFVAQVQRLLTEYRIDPSRLTLELTESLVLADIEDAILRMQALRRLGVAISMDDFGTGYSSLAYLTRLPLDELKIDRSFVRNLPGQRNDEVIAQSVIGMGRNLGLVVVAEGVERDTQLDFLHRHGCHLYQGYLFSPPLPGEELDAFLAARDQRASAATQRV